MTYSARSQSALGNDRLLSVPLAVDVSIGVCNVIIVGYTLHRIKLSVLESILKERGKNWFYVYMNYPPNYCAFLQLCECK